MTSSILNTQEATKRPLPRLLIALALAAALAGCNLEQGGFNQKSEGAVTLYWSEPLTRVNGDLLEEGDIVAYEIRYRHKSEQRYQTLKIENSGADSYHFPAIPDPDNTVFQMAAIDKDGLYSSFVTATR